MSDQPTDRRRTAHDTRHLEILTRLRRDAHKKGTFRLASGRESDFFINCKEVTLTAEGHRFIGVLLVDYVLEISHVTPIQAVAGVVLGGCQLASAVSLVSALHGTGPGGHGWNALFVRKEPKDHGTGQQIEGVAPEGSELVLLEDVATTGGSAIAAIEALRKAGFVVRNVIVLVDRKEGAEAALAAIGVKLTALFTRDDFVNAD